MYTDTQTILKKENTKPVRQHNPYARLLESEHVSQMQREVDRRNATRDDSATGAVVIFFLFMIFIALASTQG